MTPEEMVARLLYRDALMLVIDKPAGLAVHRGPRSAAGRGMQALEDHFDALRFGLPRAPALAHRLDRETSGCLVLGRHRKALETLGRLFKAGQVGKTYWAVVEGGPDADAGTIDLPLGRRDASRGWWMKVDAAGQPAVTRWKIMGRTSSCIASHHPPPQPSPARGEGACIAPGDSSPEHTRLTWLALEPVTGRTHQLRVHCQAMGWPIVGDSIYGTAPRFGGPILHLLAREIVVPLYKNREAIRVTAPVPPHMRAALAACGWTPDDDPTHAAHKNKDATAFPTP